MENLKMNVVEKYTEVNEKSFENLCNLGSWNFWVYCYPNTGSREISEKFILNSPRNKDLVYSGKIGALLDFHSLSVHCRFILHKKMKTIFLMSRVSGLSYNEIAMSLSISNESFKDPIGKAAHKRAELNLSEE